MERTKQNEIEEIDKNQTLQGITDLCKESGFHLMFL